MGFFFLLFFFSVLIGIEGLLQFEADTGVSFFSSLIVFFFSSLLFPDLSTTSLVLLYFMFASK